MNILVTICARSGSKGIKDKNIYPLLGKPLIAYSIEDAKQWERTTTLVCSTDSEQYASIAKEHGAQVPFLRPANLANDKAGKVPVIRHALIKAEEEFGKKYDVILDLDVSSPLRTIQDIEKGFQKFIETKADVAFSVTPARKNPYFNMVEINSQGFAQLSKGVDAKFLRRQDLPKVYDMNASIYFYRRDFLLSKEDTKIFDSDKVVAFEMPEITAFDIDKETDLMFIEFLMQRGLVR